MTVVSLSTLIVVSLLPPVYFGVAVTEGAANSEVDEKKLSKLKKLLVLEALDIAVTGADVVCSILRQYPYCEGGDDGEGPHGCYCVDARQGYEEDWNLQSVYSVMPSGNASKE